jgi:hypothetical protein
MAARLLVVLAFAGIGAWAFFIGRASVDRDRPPPVARGSFADGYRTGRGAAFSGFDGGWDFDAPYVVTLHRAGGGITYRFAPLADGARGRVPRLRSQRLHDAAMTGTYGCPQNRDFDFFPERCDDDRHGTPSPAHDRRRGAPRLVDQGR